MIGLGAVVLALVLPLKGAVLSGMWYFIIRRRFGCSMRRGARIRKRPYEVDNFVRHKNYYISFNILKILTFGVPWRQYGKHLRYLIVEDDDFDRLSVDTEARNFLSSKQVGALQPSFAGDGILIPHEPDILFLDIEMPGMNRHRAPAVFAGQGLPDGLYHFTSRVCGGRFRARGVRLFGQAVDGGTVCAVCDAAAGFCGVAHKAAPMKRSRRRSDYRIKQGHDKFKVQLPRSSISRR